MWWGALWYVENPVTGLRQTRYNPLTAFNHPIMGRHCVVVVPAIGAQLQIRWFTHMPV